MQNVTDTLNSTLTFSHFTSPFTPNLITHGRYRWNHTTSAAVVYRPASLLAPWPLLAASLGVSLVQAFWTFFSNLDSWSEFDDGRRQSTKKRIIDWISIVISTIRSWTVFIRAIKAVGNNSARSMSPTALFTMAICMFPGANRSGGIQCLLILLNVAFAYTSFEMMLFARYRGDPDFYRSLYLDGGNCPSVGCSALSNAYVGCNADLYYDAMEGDKTTLNKQFSASMVGTAELFLGMFYNLTLLIVEIFIGIGLLFLLLYLPLLIHDGIKLLKKMRQKKPNKEMKRRLQPLKGKPKAWKDKIVDLFHENEDDNPYDTRELRRIYATGAILVVCLTAIVILPITHSQQTRWKTLQVRDSFGPWVQYDHGSSYAANVSLEVNGSWSDCFDVPIVSDRLGFLKFWWNQNKATPLDWLAVM